ncbi:FimB/Mfa2 family fimbrial subunit [uncultured Alistipes sp.]|uniref:FimB/Mfa2 family fimbrial subunit n=1 Tax=uncultured Alistipes sp. TaxID=538949 RepID=UPI00262EC652|nr:FimB/Mfa2 family fimbrial subunit [uncultured Alistipes sp.]
MKTNGRKRFFGSIGAMLCFASVAALFASCERIYDDLDPCPHGVSLRFVYDYNMLYANAFPAEVDCLTLLVYDAEGRYVATHTEQGAALRDEGYRMRLDLPEGSYRFAAYGGVACERSSFSFVQTPAAGSREEQLGVVLDPDCLTVPERKNLHGLYWGTLALRTADLYAEGTVRMMKDTNNIRLVLQQADGEPVEDEAFDYEIIDDNTRFAADNTTVPVGAAVYTPWTRGQTVMGALDDGREVIAAYAELSVSRLMLANAPTIRVMRRSDGREIIRLPLNRYLLQLRSDRHADMQPQEFLDRTSEWELIFFLTANQTWLKTFIKVNDWRVRVNDEEF